MKGVVKDGAFFFTIVVLTNIICQHAVNSLGKRSFGESCNFGGHIASFFSEEREERACNSNMGLLCVGTYCTCPPGRVWDFSANDYGFTDRSNRGCAGAVGSPCFGASRNQQCVSNAHCKFAFCRCKPNFRANGGHCVSTGGGSSTTDTNSDEDDGQGQTRPASSTSSITFPELQNIFASIHNSQNNHNLNDFNKNNNENVYNDRFHASSYNERLPTSNDNFYNDRFQLGGDDNRDYHDHQNSRDGSKGSSSSIRFE